MKKSVTIICLATLLFSCSSDSEEAVKNFTENLAKGKVEEAKNYATEPTGKLLEMVSSMGKTPLNLISNLRY